MANATAISYGLGAGVTVGTAGTNVQFYNTTATGITITNRSGQSIYVMTNVRITDSGATFAAPATDQNDPPGFALLRKTAAQVVAQGYEVRVNETKSFSGYAQELGQPLLCWLAIATASSTSVVTGGQDGFGL